MRKNGTWVDHLEIHVMSILSRRDIRIYPEECPPLDMGNNEELLPSILLLYYPGHHYYDSVHRIRCCRRIQYLSDTESEAHLDAHGNVDGSNLKGDDNITPSSVTNRRHSAAEGNSIMELQYWKLSMRRLYWCNIPRDHLWNGTELNLRPITCYCEKWKGKSNSKRGCRIRGARRNAIFLGRSLVLWLI